MPNKEEKEMFAKLKPLMDKYIEIKLKEFKDKNLSFRSNIVVDTPTSSYSVANKKQITGASYLPLSGGTLSGDLITASLKVQGNVGFYNTTEQSQQTVTGSRGGNAALQSLLTKLATIGLIVDSSS